MITKAITSFLILLLSSFSVSGYAEEDTHSVPLALHVNGQWIGNGISYSPYRDGESPDKNDLTSKHHILEDLKLIGQNWRLIRLYGAGEISNRILEVIEENQLPIKVMLGAWIAGNQTNAQNHAQIDSAIKLANNYPETVVAVNVGNEILVDWSAHKFSSVDDVIPFIQKVKRSIKQPVTVNDDYNFWNKPSAAKIVEEIDFLGLHAYAFWNNQTLKNSISWTKSIYHDIQQRYPNMQIVMGETGWPTSRIYNDGSYEGSLIGKAGEAEQKIFFEQYNEWINTHQIPSFYFEAFDEKWKGGQDGLNPDAKAEKHWGLFYSDRRPKPVLQ